MRVENAYEYIMVKSTYLMTGMTRSNKLEKGQCQECYIWSFIKNPTVGSWEEVVKSFLHKFT